MTQERKLTLKSNPVKPAPKKGRPPKGAPIKRTLILGDNPFARKSQGNPQKTPVKIARINKRKAPKEAVTIDDLKNLLVPLVKAYENLKDAFFQERQRRLSIQTYIGESVMDELLHQSYGTSEYTMEQRLKRLISVILQATNNHQEKPEYNLKSATDFLDIWGKPEDPHFSLPGTNADIDSVKLPNFSNQIQKNDFIQNEIEENRHLSTLEKQEQIGPELFKRVFRFPGPDGVVKRYTNFGPKIETKDKPMPKAPRIKRAKPGPKKKK